MTKKNLFSKIPAMIFVLVLTTFALHASAEYGMNTSSVNASNTPKALRAELQDKRQEMRTDIQNKKIELKASIEQDREKMKNARIEFVNKQVGNLVDQMVKRFNTAVDRLTGIADRIDSRITKVKTEGKDTTNAEKYLSDARAKISQASADITKIPGLVSAGIATTTPKERFSGVRTLADTIRKELEEARNSLTKAVRSLKDLEPHRNATSTSSN